MNPKKLLLTSVLLGAALAARAGVTPDEAAQLTSTLTPLGGERAGNADGSIPAWTGGFTASSADYTAGGRRPDPFAGEKPLFSITAQNVGEYAARLSEGQRAMFKKYPDYRLDVYPTHRTAAAPQWVYDNTLANATRAQSLDGGMAITGAYGGIPFPLPKLGTEIIWNSLLSWAGEGFYSEATVQIVTASGKHVFVGDNALAYSFPFYFPEQAPDKFDGFFQKFRIVSLGPPFRAGEAITGRYPMDQVKIGNQLWVYLAGQRRVRKLPVAAYDTPSTAVSGLANIDEISLWRGALDRYDWKIVGKQEMFVPYNGNKFIQPKTEKEVMGERFLNPDFVRWELHRVWVVEANLAPGKRHVMPKRRFYVDEDTWNIVLEDTWDAKGQLWKTMWNLLLVAPDLPGTISNGPWGNYDLQTGAYLAGSMVNSKNRHFEFKRPPGKAFNPETMAGESIR